MVPRTRKARVTAVLGGAALLATALAGCSSGNSSASSSSTVSGPVTIKLLAGGNDPVSIKRPTRSRRLREGQPQGDGQGRDPARGHRR